ncbi:hypothetical protein Ancab_020599 [Ancistrocladus abbreviatus]
MDTRKRKRMLKPPLSLSSHTHYLSIRSLILCFSFFLFLLFLSNHFRIDSSGLRPARIVPTWAVMSLSASNSIQDLTSSGLLPELRIEGRVLFPDSVLVMLALGTSRSQRQRKIHLTEEMECVYHRSLNDSHGSNWVEVRRKDKILIHPILSADEYDEFRGIVRCPVPPRDYSGAGVRLRWHRSNVGRQNWQQERTPMVVPSWDMVTYEAVLDGKDTAVVFVKGLNLRPDKESDPSQFSCHFELGNSGKSENFKFNTKAITAAQEVVRCPLPGEVKKNLEKNSEVQVTIGMTSRVHGKGNQQLLVPSVAKIYRKTITDERRNRNNGKYELCVCTMVWNQASTIREWILYHAWLGVQRWFIYDNNSDDDLKEVLQELEQGSYNITRHVWPWIKTQEAGFSHCALRARDECSWVAFFDVDEFFYFPPPKYRGDSSIAYAGENSLRDLVANLSSSTTVAEMRTSCHSFGPSGLSTLPVKGVTLGYTCRLQSPERHKSIVRPDALDETLLNHVHHFRLREGFGYLNLPQGTVLINHYKYQIWEAFKAKFYRRVSTYVADWQENQNEGSRDRAPGLGTAAIEPPDWRLKFCEVWDTGLRDFVLANLADPTTGSLPWETSAQ